jgi:hypothetical protein
MAPRTRTMKLLHVAKLMKKRRDMSSPSPPMEPSKPSHYPPSKDVVALPTNPPPDNSTYSPPAPYRMSEAKTRQIEYDPKPWEEMTNAEKKALVAKLREQMREAPYDPDDDSLEILALAVTPIAGKAH